jgi:hypothetical protein
MLRAYVLPTLYSSILEAMRSSGLWKAPAGFFYLLYNTILPYTPKATIFRIETDRLNEPLDIEVIYEEPPTLATTGRKVSGRITIVARNSILSVPIYLGRGLNKINISTRNGPNEVVSIIVRTSHILALWESFARVLFSNGVRVINEQKNNIYSSLGTRLFQPYLSFSALLPDILSLQTFSSRLVTRSTIHAVGSQVGVNDFYTALALTTPIFHSMDKRSFEVDPSFDPWVNSASAYSGKEAHVWMPSTQVAAWESFIKFLENQPDIYNLLYVSEDRVVVDFQGETQTHIFDTSDSGAGYLSALAQSQCFRSVFVDIGMASYLTIKLCAASYTFDLIVTENSPIGRGRSRFDLDVPFDTGRYFDSDDIDPYSDGWVGLSLTGRFEQDYPYTHTLDTFTAPAFGTGAICTYDRGYYTFNLSNRLAEIDLNEEVNISGSINDGTFWTLQSPDGTFWGLDADATGVLVATVITSPVSATNFKVTRDDLVEVSFAITNDGILQVNDPADVSSVLNDTIYVLSELGNLWWVRVNANNIIYTEKVF